MNKVRANQIASKALKLRRKYANQLTSPISPYNLAESIGFDIRFLNIPSFEGMYLADDMVILISSERPEGRKRFTCAHELGHYALGHGTIIDEMLEHGSNKEIESEADFFASMLLMPTSAIVRSLKDMNIKIDSVTPFDVYILAVYFGVSYQGMLVQLYYNLKILNEPRFRELEKVSPKEIKAGLAGETVSGNVFCVGNWWRDIAIDACVGDLIVFDEDCTVEGGAIRSCGAGRQRFEACSPGLVRVYSRSGWSSFVRVSRKHYSGMLQFMYEEEV